MSYAIVDVDLDGPLPTVDLRGHGGVALISRRDDRVVGYAIHPVADDVLEPGQVAALVDPDPGTPFPAPSSDPPRITVAVCTHRRPEMLRRCLASLLDQTVTPDEIVVVDNAPEGDENASVVGSFAPLVRRVVEPCPGLDVARDRALRSASGAIVAFVDDDVIVDRHWFAAQRSVWSRHPDADAVTGQILPAELDTPAQVAFERRGGFRGGNVEIRWWGQDLDGNPIYPYSPGMFGAGANMAVRRRTAMTVGGFDPALDTGAPLPGGGDIDMLHRLVRRGGALVYAPGAVVFHRHRRDDDALVRQYDSWGRSLMAWAVKTHRVDPPGRPKLRLLLRWFARYQATEAARGVRRGDPARTRAALAELRGGVAGLAGTYGRSRRRTGRLLASQGRPRVALVPWGDVVEDYLAPIGLDLDLLTEELDGGWLFGFVEALGREAVDAVVVFWSSAVDRPTRRLHLPTGAVLWFLPEPRVHAAARRLVSDRYAWSRRGALDGRRGPARLAGAVAHEALPYLATPPLALRRVLRDEGIGAVLSQEYEEGRYDVLVAVGAALGLPVSATFQGGDHTRTRSERLVRSRTVRAARSLVVGAEAEAERLVRHHGVDPERIVRVPNPFDRRTLPEVDRDEARRALGFSDDEVVVAWHGRVDVRPKGMDVLAAAWERTAGRTEVPVRLSLLGTGSGSEWLHDRMGERDDVRWRDEYVVDRRVVAEHLAAADLYVLPSRQEGFPVAPVEAMAAGLPVVAADAPGVRAVVGEGHDGSPTGGIVVPVDDVEALAGAMLELIEDRDRRTDLAAAARRRVDERFSLDAVGAALRRSLLGP